MPDSARITDDAIPGAWPIFSPCAADETGAVGARGKIGRAAEQGGSGGGENDQVNRARPRQCARVLALMRAHHLPARPQLPRRSVRLPYTDARQLAPATATGIGGGQCPLQKS